jgi:hypothetical protein
MIAPVDLLAEHPGRILGRRGPRLLRLASSLVLMVLVAGVALAAIGASRAPSWTVDLAPALDDPAGTSVATQSSTTFVGLFELLLVLDDLPGLRVDSADVRQTGIPGAMSESVALANVRVTFDAQRSDMLERLRGELSQRGIAAPVILDYSTQVDGVTVNMQFESRVATERIATSDADLTDPLAALRSILTSAGVDLVSVRTPPPGDGDRIISLSAIGSPGALVVALGAIEDHLSSPSRIASVTLRRVAEGRSGLDVRFSARSNPSGDVV